MDAIVWYTTRLALTCYAARNNLRLILRAIYRFRKCTTANKRRSRAKYIRCYVRSIGAVHAGGRTACANQKQCLRISMLLSALVQISLLSSLSKCRTEEGIEIRPLYIHEYAGSTFLSITLRKSYRPFRNTSIVTLLRSDGPHTSVRSRELSSSIIRFILCSQHSEKCWVGAR